MGQFRSTLGWSQTKGQRRGFLKIYSTQPRLCSFVCEHYGAIRHKRILLISPAEKGKLDYLFSKHLAIVLRLLIVNCINRIAPYMV